jgi:DNA-binding response OmpR family regulator
MRILVVEDDPEMGRLVAKWLGEQGYECELATNGTRTGRGTSPRPQST